MLFWLAIKAADIKLAYPPPNFAKLCKGVGAACFMSAQALLATCCTIWGLMWPQAHCSTKKLANSLLFWLLTGFGPKPAFSFDQGACFWQVAWSHLHYPSLASPNYKCFNFVLVMFCNLSWHQKSSTVGIGHLWELWVFVGTCGHLI